MQLRFRLPLIVGAALLVALLAGGGGVFWSQNALARFDNDVRHHTDQERWASQMHQRFQSQMLHWNLMLLQGSDAQRLELHWRQFETLGQEVRQLSQQLRQSGTATDVSEALDAFDAQYQRMAAVYATGRQKFEQFGFDASVGDSAVRDADLGPRQALESVVQALQERSAAASAHATTQARWALQGSIGLMVLALVAGLILARRLTHSVVRPLAQAMSLTQAVAGGDLTTTVGALPADESGDMLASMQQMQQQLARLVHEVLRQADGVTLASDQLHQGHDALHAGTQQQQQAIAAATQSMAQLASSARHNTAHAQQAHDVATEVCQTAQAGGSAVRQVTTTMRAIEDTSRQVVDILSVIDGIAFQTNILALNAAVEAARAGEQGRGFAVVASEVRSLAQRAAAAAKDVRRLVESNTQVINTGADQVDAAGEAIDALVDSIGRVAQLNHDIATALQQEHQQVEAMSQVLAQLDRVAAGNAQRVSESLTATRGLHAQAAALTQAVSCFRTP